MFNDNQIQYINIKQYDKQLKVDTHIVKDKNVIKTEHTSFLIDDFLSIDSISKLTILQKNINKTYLTTICESLNQQVVLADDFFDENYEIKRLNATHNIAILKTDLDHTIEYFDQIGIDYIFSPFNILYNYLTTNKANTNSINILITHDILYALILDDEKKIVHSAVRKLTAFSDLQDAEFYEDNELENQKLYDEIHQLEIQDIITSITNDFYESSKVEVFCESIAIFYTIKQLSDEQLVSMRDTIMLEVEYQSIDFNTYLFNLSKQSNASKLSFIAPRPKENKKSFLSWVLWAIVTTALVAGILFYMQVQEKVELEKIEQLKKAKKAKVAKILADKKVAEAKIKLPNHKEQNEKISKLVLSIFNAIPYSAVLSELEIQAKDLTFVCNLLKEDTFTKDIQPKLLKLYKTSEILLMQENIPTFNAIIASSGLLITTKATIKQQNNTKTTHNYRKNRFISKKNITKRIQDLLPENTIVAFESKSKLKFITYNFHITTRLNTPKDFFKFIKQLNTLPYSVQIQYPIEFAQTNQGLEITFDLQFHQFNKK